MTLFKFLLESREPFKEQLFKTELRSFPMQVKFAPETC